MLLKIDSIQEIGRFASLRHRAPQFEGFALIYARNGYGKSTICSIIRSASEQDIKILAARKRLGAIQESRVQTLWQSSGAVVFSSGKWTNSPGEIHIFDAEYIRRNVHTADNVTRENKRNLIPVVLGAYGVQLAKMISALDSEQRERSSEQNTSEKIIKATFPIVTDVAAFIETEVPENIDELISAAERGLELSRQATAIQQKENPHEIRVPQFEIYESIAARSIETITEQAADLVKIHIDRHKMDPQGERWLKFGIEHMKGTECPFCTQDISGVGLVSVFSGYFGAEYAALTADIERLLSEIKETYGEDGERIFRVLDQNGKDFLFWGKVCEIGTSPFLNEEERAEVRSGIGQLKTLLEQKSARPLTRYQLGEKTSAIQKAIEILSRYHTDTLRCIEIISLARSEVTQSDASRSKEILEKRRALKAKLIDPIKSETASWTESSRRRSAIEIEKKAAQSKLRAHMNSEVVTKQNSINDLLEMFGATFRIVDTKASFVGREASTEFSIAIGDHTIKAGEQVSDQPSFTTVLSSGDKFTLALAFFIAQVRSNSDLANLRIIFDDPFSSQDMQRQWETTSQIRALAADARQVIVLSHDPRFLSLIEKNTSSCKTYQLTCDDDGNGSISIWSSEDELKELYVRQAQRIREFATKGTFLKDSNAESLIRDVRPFLEDYLRARFPGRFPSLLMLDGMASEIEQSGSTDPLYKSVTDLRALNEYSRDYMHGGGSPPNADQLRSQCKRVCSIVGQY